MPLTATERAVLEGRCSTFVAGSLAPIGLGIGIGVSFAIDIGFV